jgi:hypothetical protein
MPETGPKPKVPPYKDFKDFWHRDGPPVLFIGVPLLVIGLVIVVVLTLLSWGLAVALIMPVVDAVTCLVDHNSIICK